MKKVIAIIGILGAFSGATAFAAYFNPTPLTPCQVQIKNQLSYGNENEEVVILQNLLVRAGYLYAAPNGYFGPSTREAVRAFQRANLITPTGMVGPATRNAINERLCDVDQTTLSSSFGYGYPSTASYGAHSGITYVANEDPFVKVITPSSQGGAIYATPQALSSSNNVILPPQTATNATVSLPNAAYMNNSAATFPTPTPVSGGVQSTQIVYNPNIGYTIGVTPQSGSLTVSSPVARTTYREGDTVNVAWTTNNLPTTNFTVAIESTITNQSKVLTTTQANTYSFVLTKELLDSICSGNCIPLGTDSYRVVVSAPTVDIAGIASTLKAQIAPISIIRPYFPTAQASLSSSKTPVNSGEVFKLYVNVPAITTYPGYQPGTYTIKLRADCVNAVVVSIAGTQCGQTFYIPVNASNQQQEIPVVVTNLSWFKQDVVFHLTVGLNDQQIGAAQTTVTVNAQPFNF